MSYLARITNGLVQGSAPLTEVEKASGFTLAATDHRKSFICAGTFTITLPALAALGNGFECEIINDGSGDVTIAGATSVVVGVGEMAVVKEASGKQIVILGAFTVVRS